MIKLTAIEPEAGYRLLLRFSDGAWGVHDFARIVESATPMTVPLSEPAFFRRCFIEAGALVWPNGLDFSAGSLYRWLDDAGELHRDADAA